VSVFRCPRKFKASSLLHFLMPSQHYSHVICSERIWINLFEIHSMTFVFIRMRYCQTKLYSCVPGMSARATPDIRNTDIEHSHNGVFEYSNFLFCLKSLYVLHLAVIQNECVHIRRHNNSCKNINIVFLH
jgi:hypothetical protein